MPNPKKNIKKSNPSKKSEQHLILKDSNQEHWFNENDCSYILHIGPTGSGKTFNSINRLKEVGSGVYLAPLRLLAWEVFDKLNSENCRCSLVTGEEQMISQNARITASTIEMFNTSKEHEVIVIDECFMIGDKDRGKSWLNVIMNGKTKEMHIIINNEAEELITKILSLTNKKFEIKRYEMLQQFKFAESHFILSKNIPPRGVFVTFSRIDVLIKKKMLSELGKTVSVLYGNLPPEVKRKQISDFIEGKTDLMVCTDVIGMGINVPCDYLIFLEIEKFDGEQNRRLRPMEIKQISGRTGRFGLSSENAFVSSLSKKKLNYIKSNYNAPSKVQKAYFGMDYDFFSSFPKETTIDDRIKSFESSNLIPDVLKPYINKENVQKYRQFSKSIEKKCFGAELNWIFLTAPTKNNNEHYFQRILDNYAFKKELVLPNIVHNMNDAKSIEDKISEIELYLNLTRNLEYNDLEKKQVLEYKESMIQKLDSILLSKKLSSKKKCKTCNNLLSITFPHPYCDDCFKSRYMSNDYWY